MAEVLLQNRGRFNFYNETTGRFRFNTALSLQEVQDVVNCDAGETGMAELPRRLKRSKDFTRLRETLESNRAGEGGMHLCLDDCLEFYLS